MTRRPPSDLGRLLRSGWTEPRCLLERRHLAWLLATAPLEALKAQPSADPRALVAALLEVVRACLRDWQQWQAEYADFQHRVQASPLEALPGLAGSFAARMGADHRKLAGDRAAFTRWMSADALAERHAARVGLLEHRLAVVIDRIGAMAAPVLADDPAWWDELALADQIGFVFGIDAAPALITSACDALYQLWQSLPAAARPSLPASLLADLNQLAGSRDSDPLLRAAALRLVLRSDPATAPARLLQTFSEADARDGAFLRARLLSDRAVLASEQRLVLLRRAATDASAHVRQQCAEACLGEASPAWPVFDTLLGHDPDPVVRGFAAVRLIERFGWLHPDAVQRLLGSLQSDPDPQFRRLLVDRMTMALRDQEIQLDTGPHADWQMALQQRVEDADPAVRRQAVRALEWLWLAGDESARVMANYFRHALAEMPLGRRVLMPWPARRPIDPATVARVLACLCQDDFGVDFSARRGGLSLLRGEDRVRRLWRIWHEWRQPSSEKRQGYLHTTGRRFAGDWIVPSSVLAELSPTKVPGEPRHDDAEGGDRVYLPLLDQALSALDSDWPTRPIRLVSAEGVTEITPPRSLWARLVGKWRLSRRFASIAESRNWYAGAAFEPTRFVQELQRAGLKLQFVPHPGARTPPWAQRFFPALPLAPLELWRQFADYSLSIYQNTLHQLALFLAGVMALFLGRHTVLNQRIRRARTALPLVIGGWGTRGKSGTERLKAALFSGLGYRVLSKTTGCEAMVLHGHPSGSLQELFLYRPYDKATIWEHASVMQLAAELRVDVFLWECMGLNPDYVQILQRQWSRDDLSTLTNTYPDHEDIQGPAGSDIPRVMVRFLPDRGRLITTEESMLPMLRDGCRRRQCALDAVGWDAAWLLPRDLLQRFPYQEHPSNIALVLRMAEPFGVPRDQALKLMADRVVPDLGVLKTSPVAEIDGRKLQFSNGMSANERRGCLNNWQRLGFAEEDRRQRPGHFVTVVVNNRADRVARSRVFAAIIVRDLSADLILLIGSNLGGLQNFIEQEWAAFEETITLWPPGAAAEPLQRWQLLCSQARIPISAADAASRRDAMLRGLGVDPGAASDDLPALLASLAPQLPTAQWRSLEAFCQRDLEDLAVQERITSMLQSGFPKDAEIDVEVRKALRRWFERRLCVIEDLHACGDRVIRTIVENSPAGLLNRIIGIQNIKGTGLDFVYRWQHFERCHALTQVVLHGQRADALRALNELGRFGEFSLLTDELLQQALPQARQRGSLQSETAQAELALIESNRAQAMQQIEQRLHPGQRQGDQRRGWLERIEEFLDAGDAQKRRRRADRIYQDLAAARISHPHAARELAELMERQKGGWLRRRLFER